ncbi:MAG: hypothetical protein SWH68_11045 [Thermodesulfobacteriota bacterium]|nr:hypothetical protein [Thermodesulfobacteriota bacterium]
MSFHSRKNILAERRLIVEMMNASMQLAYEKGPHPLTPGCNCIACVNKRKRKLAAPEKPWRYRL